jgi:very-short-patch-repair endonuclease
MGDQNHKPKWHVSEKQRGNARAVRRELTEPERIIWCNVRVRRFQGARRDTSVAAQGCGVVRFNHLDIMKNEAGVLEQLAVAFGGSETFSRTLRRTRGHAGREDVP